MKQQFHLVNDAIKQNAINFIRELPVGVEAGIASLKQIDPAIEEAAAATDSAESNKLYQEAEAMLATDFPSIPMWYYTTTMGWSDKVTNVKITAFGTIDLPSLTLK